MASGKFNIKALRQQANQPSGEPNASKTVEPVNQIAGKPENKGVNLCVRVPKPWRKHWAIQAKIQDVTMTEVIVAALIEKFGLPDDQISD